MSSPQCRGKLYDETPCLHEIIDDSGWCIFHYPDKQKKLIAKFERALEIEIKSQKRDHPEYIDYTEYHFPLDVELNQGEYNAIYAQSAVFHGKLSLGGSTFNELVDFRFATFKKGVAISGSIFKNKVLFHLSTFYDELYVSHNLLYSRMDFFNINIHDKFTIYQRNWDLPSDKREDELQYDITVGGILRIGNPTLFEKAKILIRGKTGEVSPSFAGGLLFLSSNLENVEFVEEIWPRENGDVGGRKITIDEVLLKLPLDQIMKEVGIRPNSDQVLQSYRRLRENYEKAKRYSEAGDFFIGEMEVNRKYKTKQRQLFDDPDLMYDFIPEKRSLLDSGRILYSLYYYLGCYGESISRPITWSILLVIFFMFYRLSMLPPSEVFRHTYGEYLQMSIITYFQLKSDTIIDLIQRIFSAPLLGMIFVAMKRRMERK